MSTTIIMTAAYCAGVCLLIILVIKLTIHLYQPVYLTLFGQNVEAKY
jgi:hypothetical protein